MSNKPTKSLLDECNNDIFEFLDIVIGDLDKYLLNPNLEYKIRRMLHDALRGLIYVWLAKKDEREER